MIQWMLPLFSLVPLPFLKPAWTSGSSWFMNKEIQPVYPKGNQSWIFIRRTDAEAETPILWPLDAKNWLLGKDPDAGKDWRQEEKGTTEDEMAGWHHKYPRLLNVWSFRALDWCDSDSSRRLLSFQASVLLFTLRACLSLRRAPSRPLREARGMPCFLTALPTLVRILQEAERERESSFSLSYSHFPFGFPS